MGGFSSGYRDDRRSAQISVLEASREVRRAYGLSEAYAGAAADARIAVGHVSSGGLGMRQDTPNAKPLEFDEGLTQYRLDKEDVSKTIPLEHPGDKLRAGHS